MAACLPEWKTRLLSVPMRYVLENIANFAKLANDIFSLPACLSGKKMTRLLSVPISYVLENIANFAKLANAIFLVCLPACLSG